VAVNTSFCSKDEKHALCQAQTPAITYLIKPNKDAKRCTAQLAIYICNFSEKKWKFTILFEKLTFAGAHFVRAKFRFLLISSTYMNENWLNKVQLDKTHPALSSCIELDCSDLFNMCLYDGEVVGTFNAVNILAISDYHKHSKPQFKLEIVAYTSNKHYPAFTLLIYRDSMRIYPEITSAK
jgi:hypothetical protein